MTLPPHKQPQAGDYTIVIGRDGEHARYDAVARLVRNGCQSFRADQQDGGSCIMHGYLQSGLFEDFHG